MTTFTIKHGIIWQGNKPRSVGETVEIDDAQRDVIDPNHTDLQSASEAKLEAEKLAAEADLAKQKAEAFAKLDAEHAAKQKAEDAKKKGGKS